MKFAYVQNLRIPNQLAHSVAVIKAAEAAAKLGYETTLVIPRRTQPPGFKPGPIHQFYDLDEPVKVVMIPVPQLLSLPDFVELAYKHLRYMICSWTFALRAYLYLWRNQIDVIQTGDREIIALCSLLRWWYKPKIIYDLHDDYCDVYNLTLLAIGKASLSEVIVNCQYLKDSLTNRGVSPDKIMILPNGFEPKYFEESNQQRPDAISLQLVNRFVFGYIGRLETKGEEKGIDQMLKAVTLVNRQIPISLVVVGGPDELADKYRQLAQSLKLSRKQCLILGQVEPKKVGQIIKQFDVAALLYPDTFRYRHIMSPMKAIEYLAAGKQIIASNLPTIRQVLKRFAVYVDPSDPVAIAKALELVYHQRHEDHLYEKARKTYIQKFTWTNRQKTIFRFLSQGD